MTTKKSSPKKSSRQFWPRRRSKQSVARVRSWADEKNSQPLGFLGYKAQMAHMLVVDNFPKSLTKGQTVAYPITIVECPPMMVIGINFYKKAYNGWQIVKTHITSNLDKDFKKHFSKTTKLPKNNSQLQIPDDFDDIRLIIASQPHKAGSAAKKPKISEIAIGGSKEDKLNYAKEKLGKEVMISDVFKEGMQIDIHGITTGKGFQGPVKRHGVSIRSQKSEKARRGNIRGPWTGAKMWTAPHSGKMGYHLRTEYNKWVLKLEEDGKKLNPKAGIAHYGIMKNNAIILKGSILGPKKRPLLMTFATRANKKIPKTAPEIKEIVLK